MITDNKTETEISGTSENAGGPEVEFLDLNTNRDYRFQVRWSDTLHSALDTAYTKIGEAPTGEDKLLCEKDGESLMGYLALTFEKLRDQHICPGHKYKLRRKTGGA
jgi:hypothetical protein